MRQDSVERKVSARRLLRRAEIATFLVILVSSLATSARATTKLERLWEVSLGESSGRMPGVCAMPDGTVYAANPSGQWTVISADGKVLSQKTDIAVTDVTSLACTSDGTLYANVPSLGRVVVFTRELAQIRIVTLPRPFRFIYVDRAANLYGLGLAGGKLVHRIRTDGSVTSFGDAPAYSDAREARFNTISTTAVIDEQAGQIVYKPQYPYLFFVYDLSGHFIAAHKPTAAFGPARVEKGPYGARPVPSDFSGPFVKLSNGTYVVITIRPRQQPNGNWRQPATLEMFDNEFQSIGAPLPTTGFGMLVTNDSQDNLYGVRGAPTLRLVKARIVESHP